MKRTSLLLIITIVFQSAFAQKQLLGFNLLAGETYHLIMQSSSTVKQDVNGQKVKIAITLPGKIAFKVTGTKDSIYDIVSYQQLAITMKLPNGDMNFNSDKQQ
jgi:hypothetical protein